MKAFRLKINCRKTSTCFLICQVLYKIRILLVLIQLSIHCLISKPMLNNFQVFPSPILLIILKRRVISQSSLNYKTQIFCQKLIVFRIYSHTSQGLSINLQFSLFLKMLQTLFMLKAFLLMHLKEKYLIFLDPFLVIRLFV